MLIVENDPIIALDFEDTIIGFGVRTVRTASTVARSLQMMAERLPDFILRDDVVIKAMQGAIGPESRR